MKRSLLLALMVFLCHLGYAADSAVISGKVVGEDNQPLVFVSVVVYHSSDSSFVVGNVTDEQGYYSLTVPNGGYYLKVSYLSYHPQIIGNIKVTGTSVKLPDIVLKSDVEELDGAEIVLKKSTVEFKIDKKVFNVGEDIASQGKDALQVLDKVPTVNTTPDGGIKINGSSNVRVLIDGKPIMGNLKDVLKTISADMIESIEVITNPSARYDAEGEAGIINIILKKQRKNGLNGSVTLSGGSPLNSSTSVRLAYRTDKFSLNTSFRYYNYQTTSTDKTEQRYNDEDTTVHFFQNSLNKSEHEGVNFTIGGDYNFNKYNTAGISITIPQYTNSGNKSLYYYDLDKGGNLLEQINRNNKQVKTGSSTNINLTHTKTYATKNKKWATSLRLSRMPSNTSRQISENIPVGNIMPQTLSSFEETDQTNFFFKTDYHHPLSEKTFYEVGAQSSMMNAFNNFGSEQLGDDEQWHVIDAYTNKLIYDEDVHAAYALYGNEKGKLTYQFGLRSEYTFMRTELVKTHEVNPREYINLFPSAHLSYNLDSFNSLQLSYSRRIFRPTIFFLTPTTDISSRRNFYNGDPNIIPLYSNAFEFSYLKEYESGTFMATIDYSQTKNGFAFIFTADSTGSRTSSPINLSSHSDYGLYLLAEQEINDWWEAYISVYGYSVKAQGEKNGTDYSLNAMGWYVEVNSTFYIGESWEAQVDFEYYGGEKTILGKDLAVHIFDFSIGKEIFNGNGRLAFNVEDVMNGDIDRSISQLSGYYSYSHSQYQKRQFSLSLNYSFDKKFPKRVKNK